MKIYACGSRPDHFTGWGGVGKPIYDQLYWQSGRDPNNLGETWMATTIASGDPSGWGYGCMWQDFSSPVTDFWVATEGFYTTSLAVTPSDGVNYAALVLHADGDRYLMVKSGLTTAYTASLVLATSLSDVSTHIDLGIPYTKGSDAISVLNIHVSGCGTTNGAISWYTQDTMIGAWKGDLTDYPSFHALSHHNNTPSTTSFLAVFYTFVSDVNTRGHDFNYEILSGTQGTRADWVGDAATFTTYPVDYTSTDGLYATEQSATCTFKPAKTYSLPSTAGAKLGTVLLQGSMVSDITDAAIAPYVLDGTTSGAGTSTTLSTTGKNYSFNLTTNPATGAAWTIADINAVELGFIRTDDDVSTAT